MPQQQQQHATVDLKCMMEDGYQDPLYVRDRGHLLDVVGRKDAQLLRCSVLVGVLVLLQCVAIAALATFVVSGYTEGSPNCKVTHGEDRSSSEPMRAAQQQMYTSRPIPSVLLTVNESTPVQTGKLVWQQAGDHNFMEGFTYMDGHLVVPSDGLYSVFVQVTYRSRDHKFCNGSRGMLLVKHVVWLTQEAYRKDLAVMTSSDTVNCTLDMFTKSLYTSAVFRLHKDDWLSVSSENPGLISLDKGDAFFGAYLLSQKM